MEERLLLRLFELVLWELVSVNFGDLDLESSLEERLLLRLLGLVLFMSIFWDGVISPMEERLPLRLLPELVFLETSE